MSNFRIVIDTVVHSYTVSMMTFKVRIALFYVVALIPSLGWGQLAPSPGESPVSTASGPTPDEGQIAAIKHDVNLLDVYFTVKGSDGSPVQHLDQQNCTLIDDNVPQTFKSFGAGNNEPLNLGILVDTSMSQIAWLPMEQDRGSQFIRHALRRGDQGFLTTFDVNVELLQEYTNNQVSLIRALSQVKINSGGGVQPTKDAPGVPPWKPNKPKVGPDPVPIANPGGTHFYDAIYQATNEGMKQVSGRKALIVLTDGDDQNSQISSQDAVAEAEKNNVSVFVIWSGGPRCFDLKTRREPWERKTPGENNYPLPDDRIPPTQKSLGDVHDECAAAHWAKATCPGYYVAECIARHTGGSFIVPKDSNQLEQAFGHVEDELRSQYWVSYVPSDTKADGHFHQLEIQCGADNGQNLKVQMRRGYYAPSAGK